LPNIHAYLGLIPIPDLVIFPHAPARVCENRVLNRGIWEPFKHKNPADISRFIDHAAQIVNFTVDSIKQEGWQIIEVDNSSPDSNRAIAELRSRLSNLSGISQENQELPVRAVLA
jgi:hypothetical protein